ncbi:FkbM family methyltransferase [Cryomorpha ignava]|uniref:FkbM family methyltransferase n=1 Tax=Cryomorpha ignava TaxID=101383 RepID=A0A7K3WSI3_9FLAO|nr:FkbM family methyltransferase [Cryomorpha ignava]NEN24416.1 FkbM family methyltransferase [Cryomorpha ignava]
MKNTVKRLLQRLLGFNTYLKIFARYKIATLKSDKKEGDFFAFMSLLKNEGLILDIGANLGIMTWHLLKDFSNAEIWAFEPIPENNKILHAVTEKCQHQRFRIFDCALGDKPGIAKMVLPNVSKVKMQGLSHIVHESIGEFNQGDFYEVEIDTLDNLIDSTKKVQGIKLDVENFEYFVLKGGEELIERDKPIIYTELWVNENREKCLNFIKTKGYAVKVHVGNKLIDFSPETYSGQNFFFIPN